MSGTQSQISKWRESARNLKHNVGALYFVVLHPHTPWYAKAIAILVVAYALSPIDLIPDFIPVLGYLDDLILLPIGIWFVLKLIPAIVMDEARQKAAESRRLDNALGFIAAAVI